jgi:hypothetical protein
MSQRDGFFLGFKFIARQIYSFLHRMRTMLFAQDKENRLAKKTN